VGTRLGPERRSDDDDACGGDGTAGGVRNVSAHDARLRTKRRHRYE
jgi:hypothetical protein